MTLSAPLKTGLVWAVKLAVVGLAVYLLRRAEALDWALLTSLRFSPAVVAAVLFIWPIHCLANAARWQIILARANQPASLGRLLTLVYAGVFFNTLLPGGSGGDAAKAVYAVRSLPGDRLMAGASVVVDRLIGVLVMAALALAALVPIALSGRADLGPGPMIAAGAILLSGGAGLFVFGKLITSSRLGRVQLLGTSLARLADLWPTGRALVAAAGLSALMHLLTALLMIVLASGLGAAVDWPAWAGASWISQLVNQIPLSPGGLGLGETSLFGLLSQLTSPEAARLGPSVFILFRMSYLLVALVGAVIVLFGKIAARSENKV